MATQGTSHGTSHEDGPVMDSISLTIPPPPPQKKERKKRKPFSVLLQCYSNVARSY